MRVNDAVLGGSLVIFAIALAVYAQAFPDIPGQQYGASVFPTVVAFGFAGAGLVLIAAGVRQHAPLVAWADWARERHGLRNVVVSVAAVVFYIVASDALGFILTMLPILVVMLRLFGVGWLTTGAVALVVTLLIQYVFGSLLYVPLPWGLLEPVRW
ncbi:MAG TPA: tripartite tricarboxylate transporter TctB family protein [Propylenella sp.]|jgi:putative tricarboxylic transport membrane protein